MRCPRVQYLYDEYVAGTLDHKTAEAVDLHLAECAECRDYFQTNDDLAELIFEGNEVVHPGEPYLNQLSERVMERVMSESSSEMDRLRLTPPQNMHPLGRPLWWAGLAAAVALVVLGIQRDPKVNLPRELAALNELEESAASESVPADMAPNPPAESRPSEAFALAGTLEPSGRLEPVAAARSGAVVPAGPSVLSSTSGRGMQTVSKSVTHPDRITEEEMDLREQALAILGNAPTPGMTPVRISRPPSPEATRVDVGPALIEQIIVMDAIGTPQSRERIYELLEAAGQSPENGMSELMRAGDPALLKQWSVFRQAEEAYRENRQEIALKTFELAAQMDPESVLGLRAHMRIADLRYQGWADFEGAQESYARCAGPNAAKAFTRLEAAHIERRNNLLGRYAAVDWKPLRVMHTLSNAEWAEAVTALKSLAHGTEAALLMPEAAQIVIARLQGGGQPTPDEARVMLEAISHSAQAMENRAAQAWLAMCMGEIYLKPLGNPEAALNAYQSVTELDPQSAPADHARQRQYQIRSRSLR